MKERKKSYLMKVPFPNFKHGTGNVLFCHQRINLVRKCYRNLISSIRPDIRLFSIPVSGRISGNSNPIFGRLTHIKKGRIILPDIQPAGYLVYPYSQAPFTSIKRKVDMAKVSLKNL
jgi:hypothetical protein